MKKIKLICFDVGGTLIYHKKAFLYNKLKTTSFLNRYGIKKDTNIRHHRGKIFHSKIHRDLNEAISLYAKKIGVIKNYNEFIYNLKKFFDNSYKHIFWYGESKGVLQRLKKSGYKIVLITNWHQHGRDDFDIIGLNKYADHMLISAEFGKIKPHPSLFKQILRIFKVRPSESLMVGNDYERDYLAAKKLGMDVLLINRKRRKYDKKVKQIRNLKEVIKYVNNI